MTGTRTTAMPDVELTEAIQCQENLSVPAETCRFPAGNRTESRLPVDLYGENEGRAIV